MLNDDSGALASRTSVLQAKPSDSESQLHIFKAISRFLPDKDEHHSFWWKVTGRHVARMLHEARYPKERQVELLLFHRFTVVPRLGPKPTSTEPWFKSSVAHGAGDGSPIGYSWRWGTGSDSKPVIAQYVEPMGSLTGTAADPLNEFATKEMLRELGKILPSASMSSVWKFAAHLRPNMTDEATRATADSSMVVGMECGSESDTIDVIAGLNMRAPQQVSELTTIFSNTMRDIYGPDTPLDCLNAVRDFIETHPHGKYLTMLGTTGIDCRMPESSRFKIYVTTRNMSFDHIASIMTLGGRKKESTESLKQLRELWYGLKGLDAGFPTSAQSSTVSMNGRGDQCDTAADPNTSGVAFSFAIHPKYTVPQVKLQVDIGKHATSDWAAIEAVTSFLAQRGQARDAQAYRNTVCGIVSEQDLRTHRGLQASFEFAIKNGEIDITSYFLPQVYRRFAEIQDELNPMSQRRQRRSRFDSY
ncbi:hypothetical protein AJ80_00916 [Polytolypa hystricis UAMH7299]|uniref:Prenyltransferase nscD n=1 Tax=Polytolypa hystricis (strain UAMH7299) TaxID=1447883 RepID=A0A2B7Z2U0_POLH7|nr:hypothetical protein AJ80_00916 [Polytolypa hystricis UAMH7299]